MSKESNGHFRFLISAIIAKIKILTFQKINFNLIFVKEMNDEVKLRRNGWFPKEIRLSAQSIKRLKCQAIENVLISPSDKNGGAGNSLERQRRVRQLQNKVTIGPTGHR